MYFSYQKKIITCIIILSFLVSPVGVFAQGLGGGAGFGGGGGLSGMFQFGSTIGSLLNCTGILGPGPGGPVGDVTDAVGDTVSNVLQTAADSPLLESKPFVGPALNTLGSLIDGGLDEALETVGDEVIEEVTDPVPPLKVEDDVVAENTSELKQEAEKNRETNEAAVYKESCLDKVVHDLIVRVMNRATLATVQWINSGFDGEAFFLTNESGFFQDLVADEFQIFAGELRVDGQLLPFHQTILATITNVGRRRLQQNLQQSMHAFLDNATVEQWQVNFSVGGWTAYTAFVEPANNMFGSFLLASEDIVSRTSGTNITRAWSARQELDRGLGYMSARECAQTLAGGNLSYLPSNHPLHMPSSRQPITQLSDITPAEFQYIFTELQITSDPQIIAKAEEARKRSICTSWRTVTPGSWIANSLTSVTTDGLQNQFIKADEWNENVGLILDALFLQAFEGIANLWEPDGNYSSNPSAPNFNAAWAVVNDPDFSQNYGNAANATPGFYDLSNLSNLLEIQNQYKNLIVDFTELTIDMIQGARDLDYCVPGPNPQWLSIAQANISNGNLFNVIPAPENSSTSEKQQYYAQKLEEFTGINLDPDVADITSHTDLTIILNNLFNQYVSYINQNFTQNATLPSMRGFATNLYNLIASQYQPAIITFAQEVELVDANIAQVEQVLTAIQELPQLEGADFSPFVQQLENQVLSLQGIATDADLVSLQQDFEAAQSVYNQILTNRDACVQEVESSAYQGLVYRTESPFTLSSEVVNLPTTETFAENMIIGGGQNVFSLLNIDPLAILAPADLSVFEEYIGPIF